MRTERWHYIRYADGGEELYDHEKDPLESTNLAKDSKFDTIKIELSKWLPNENCGCSAFATGEEHDDGSMDSPELQTSLACLGTTHFMKPPRPNL